MGQQLESELGVSVSLPLTNNNINKIIELLDIPNLRVYISGYGENRDEIIDFIYEEDNIDISYDVLNELTGLTSEEQFNYRYNEMELQKDIVFNFMCICTAMYSENRCFRKINKLFYNDEILNTAIDLIENIQQGINLFKSKNIPDKLIRIGHTLHQG